MEWEMAKGGYGLWDGLKGVGVCEYVHAGGWVGDVYVWGSGYTSQNKAGIKQGPA